MALVRFFFTPSLLSLRLNSQAYRRAVFSYAELIEDFSTCFAGFLASSSINFSSSTISAMGRCFGVSSVDVAVGGYVVVVFLQHLVIYDAAEIFILFPPDEDIREGLYAVIGDVFLVEEF